MNALPTATACALPHGQAHGIPRAIQSGSVAGTVHAKRSEVKGPEVKGPEVKTPDLKGPEVKMNQPWSPSHHGVQKVDAMAATSPAAAPVSVAPADEMMPLTRMEDLPNLDNDVMCDGVECERPADAVLAQTCQCQIRALGCWQCHDHDLELPGVARCGSCGALVTWATAWTIVHVLRPRSAS